MARHEHQALHRMFWNDLPHEQLIKLLGINRTSLVREVLNDITSAIYDNLERWNDYFYKDWVWR